MFDRNAAKPPEAAPGNRHDLIARMREKLSHRPVAAQPEPAPASEARRVADALRSQHGLTLSEEATKRLITESGGDGTPPAPRGI